MLPRVLRGENVIVAAHGNSLRALVMVLERLSPKEIVARELATGVPLIYRLNADATWRRSRIWRRICIVTASGSHSGPAFEAECVVRLLPAMTGCSYAASGRNLMSTCPPPSRAWRACG